MPKGESEMKKMKKIMIASVALLACAFSFAGVTSVNSAMAAAEDTFYMDGASVRMKDPSGIRFHTIVNEKTEGYTYGTLLIPVADFTGDALTVDTPNVVDIPAINWKSETEYTTALGGVVSDGVITNFPKSQYNNVIMARSYAKDANGNVVEYTETTERTLAQVASISLTDTREDYKITDAEDRTYLADICDYVLGEDGFELVQESVELVIGETLDLAGMFATTNGNEGLKAIWTVDGEDYVTVTKDEIGAVVSLKAKEAGEVLVTATIGTKTAELTVTTKAREVAANEVVDFKYATDLQRARIENQGDLNSFEFVEEYQGSQGVLKVDAKAWGRLGFAPIQDVSQTTEKYLVVRMWVEKTASADAFMYLRESALCKSFTSVQTGRWLNFYFSADFFRAQWYGKEAGQGFGSYYSVLATNSTTTYYIDKIYMTNEMEVIDFVHSADVASVGSTSSVEFSYVDEFQGAQGVLKADAGSWGWLKFKAVMGGSNGYTYDNYAGAKYIVLRMYATNACEFQIANSNGSPLNKLKLNRWTDIYFDAVAFMKQWVDTGNYYSALIFKSAGTYYIDKIYMAEELPEKFVMLDFNDESSKSYLTSGGWDIQTTQYCSEFEGAQGVMAITATGGYALQCFKFNEFAESQAFRTHYTHFVIRAYADTASTSSYIRLDYDGTVQQPVEAGVWKDYVFTITEFENFLNNATYKGLRFGGKGIYYIDCMYMTNL